MYIHKIWRCFLGRRIGAISKMSERELYLGALAKSPGRLRALVCALNPRNPGQSSVESRRDERRRTSCKSKFAVAARPMSAVTRGPYTSNGRRTHVKCECDT